MEKILIVLAGICVVLMLLLAIAHKSKADEPPVHIYSKQELLAVPSAFKSE